MDAVNRAVGATGSVSRYSLAMKQLIKYMCSILYTEIKFNQNESLVGESSVSSCRAVCNDLILISSAHFKL